jgi:short-subunit dehydrogenase
MNMDWHGKNALITGASSGIGADAARKLAKEDLRVWLVARRADRLRQVADEIERCGGQAEILPADLALPAEREALYARVNDQIGTPDVLINNAGSGWYGYYAKMPWDLAEELLSVNMLAAAHLTRLFLPGMLARGSGHIINVGSIAGKLPNQGIAIYAGTKSFLDAFTTALHRELRGSGVHASIVLPGPVVTEFFDRAVRRPEGHPVPAERFAVPVQQVTAAIWSLLKHPRRSAYVPAIFRLSVLVDPAFGWLIDLLGPILLRRASRKNSV